MAHGLENRVPFMDNDLVDFAMTCPVNLKLILTQAVDINENDHTANELRIFKKPMEGNKSYGI